MAKELVVSHKTGETLHALIRNKSKSVWQTTTGTFVTYNDTNKANYAITMTEDSGGSCYSGDFPSAITAQDRYFVQVLDASDIEHYFGWIDWTGSEEDFATLRNRIR